MAIFATNLPNGLLLKNRRSSAMTVATIAMANLMPNPIFPMMYVYHSNSSCNQEKSYSFDMISSIFVNLPVADVARSRKFNKRFGHGR